MLSPRSTPIRKGAHGQEHTNCGALPEATLTWSHAPWRVARITHETGFGLILTFDSETHDVGAGVGTGRKLQPQAHRVAGGRRASECDQHH